MNKRLQIVVEDHGSIVLLRPLTKRTREWLEENTDPDAQWWGGALVVEPRYVEPILEGLREVLS